MVYTRSKSRVTKRKISGSLKSRSKTKRKRSGGSGSKPKTMITYRGIRDLPGHLTLSQLCNESLENGKIYVGWVHMTAVKTFNKLERGKYVIEREAHEHFAGKIWQPDDPDHSIPVQLTVDELQNEFVLSSFCGEDVLSSYVHQSLRYSTNVFFVFYPAMVKSVVTLYSLGFITGYRTDPKTFYIDVICSKKYKEYPDINGKFIMLFVEQLLHEMGIREIQLSAIPYVLLYYPKQLKYRHRHSCNDPPEFEHFTPKLLHRLQHMRDSLPKTNEEALSDADFVEYMVELFKAGYLTKDCDPMDHKTGKFKSDEKLAEMLVGSKNCQSDGFKMRKCLT